MSTERTPETSDYWAVRFNTDDDMLHPVRYGKRGGPQITYAQVKVMALLYLAKNKKWLTAIDEIYAPLE